MPLFILLSGYCFNRDKESKKVLAGCIEDIIIYVIFQASWVVLRSEYSIEQILTPRSTLWFLLCIPFWKLLALTTRNIDLWLLVVCSILFSLLSGIIAKPEIVQNVFTCFFYFALGMLIRKYSILPKLRRKELIVPSLIIMGAVFVVYYCLDLNTHRYIIGRGSFLDTAAPMFLSFVTKLGFQILSIIACMCMIILTYDCKHASENGKYTLGIYLLHLFPLHIFMSVGRIFNFPQNYLFVGIYALLSVYICLFITKTKIGKFITKPIKVNL